MNALAYRLSCLTATARGGREGVGLEGGRERERGREGERERERASERERERAVLMEICLTTKNHNRATCIYCICKQFLGNITTGKKSTKHQLIHMTVVNIHTSWDKQYSLASQ